MKALVFISLFVFASKFCLSQTLSRAEYFFDTDPGPGNGTALPVSAGSSVNQNFNISTASLTTGFHTLNARVRSDEDVWSLFASRTFYIIKATSSPVPATQIDVAEYFIDDDPGIGEGIAIPITPSSPVTFALTLPVSALTSGFHTLNIRARDDQDRWSLFGQRTFYVVPPVSTVASVSITKAEYFFGSDPGTGNGISLPITSGDPQNNLFSIDVSSLAPGFRQLGIRYLDNLGRWSHFTSRAFYIIPGNIAAPAMITQLEYFIDNDPSLNASLNGSGITISPSATIDNNFFIDLTGIPSGDHQLYVRAKDDKGYWSTVSQDEFTILTCTTPAPPVAGSVSRCGEGEIILAASGATGSQEFRWYDDETTSTVLYSGSEFETENLTATRDYFVSIFDPGTLCESTRSRVTATIELATKPSVNPAGSVTFCEGGSVILSAPQGFQQYIWSNGEVTREIFVNDPEKYSVQVGDGTCVSPPSDTTHVSIVNPFAKPLVTVTGALTFCAGDSVMLSAPAGFSNYRWSSGEVTQSIYASSNGHYTVQTGDQNCMSVSSDATIVSAINAPATPEITSSGTFEFCEGESVTLSAPSGFSTYLWSSGETTQQITVDTEGSYRVQTGDGICLSAPSDVAEIKVNNIPSQPVPEAFGPVIFCEGESVTLSAPAGFSQYEWSSGETTRQILIQSNGSYSVRTGEGDCFSSFSDTVEVLVMTAATKPELSVTGNTTVCGAGSVTISGPEGFDYRWSNGATTQTIEVSETGVYTLQVQSAGSCLSAASDPVIVTFLTPPCGGVISNQSPEIDNSPLAGAIEGIMSIDLTEIVTDPDANIDYTTLRLLTVLTARGAPASIDAAYHLVIDYSGLPFTGTDRITLEVCDLSGACIQQVLDIEVVGAIQVYNGLSPDGDGKNDFLFLKYVNVVEGAAKNKVTIFNRWGDVVFDVADYNNLDHVFTGLSNKGDELPSGTYFYKVEFEKTIKPLTGFLTLIR